MVTGISGSGKSSLINGTLYPILNKHFYRAVQEPLPYKKIEGIENIDKIVDVDQTPIGRTPRSESWNLHWNVHRYQKSFCRIARI